MASIGVIHEQVALAFADADPGREAFGRFEDVFAVAFERIEDGAPFLLGGCLVAPHHFGYGAAVEAEDAVAVGAVGRAERGLGCGLPGAIA